MAEIKFSLHLVSDAEPGSGFGSELINSLVPRNLEGKPIIPASHIKGLMRDHLEKIANDLGKNDLKRLVSQCFGEEGNSDSTSAMTISISDLLPEGTANTHTISRTKLSECGTASDTSLRTGEAISAGSVFTGTIRITGQSSLASDLLLRLGLLSINAIGGGRNRGCGECFIKITRDEGRMPGTTLKELIEITMSKPADDPQIKLKYLSGDPKKRVLLKLTFNPEGPICLPETPIVETNSIRSGFSISASAIQGMILHRVNAVSPEIADACFASPLFRAWPLFPTPKDTTGLPVRTSQTHLMSKLTGETGEYQFWEEIIGKYKWQDVPKGSPLKSADGVIAPSKNGVILWRSSEMPRQISAHCVIRNKRNLFTVESMAITEPFTGIVSMPEDAAQIFSESIDTNSFIQLGKARSVRGGGTLQKSEFTFENEFANSTLFDEHKKRIYIVQSPILIPGELEINAAGDLLKRIVSEAGWGEVDNASASIGILFGWNRSGKGDQIQDSGRLKARKVINPGSIFLLNKPLANDEHLLNGIGGGREQGLGAVLPHPGIAKSKYPGIPYKIEIKSDDESGKRGFELWQLSGKTDLSASQINSVRQILLQSKEKALEYLDRQKSDRPLPIWESWESVIKPLRSYIDRDPESAKKAMKVWYDLKVAEEK
jgi:CRISPR/Cas system CSM-associated protein Csm3 (group 7 of RAMP superfamily)